jgi:hypothetical protein
VILGIISTFIAILSIFIGLIGEYIIGALGVVLIIMSIPILFVGLVKKGNELPLTRKCPKCGRDIPLDTKVCSYCQNVLTDVLRHEY